MIETLALPDLTREYLVSLLAKISEFDNKPCGDGVDHALQEISAYAMHKHFAVHYNDFKWLIEHEEVTEEILLAVYRLLLPKSNHDDECFDLVTMILEQPLTPEFLHTALQITDPQRTDVLDYLADHISLELETIVDLYNMNTRHVMSRLARNWSVPAQIVTKLIDYAFEKGEYFMLRNLAAHPNATEANLRRILKDCDNVPVIRHMAFNPSIQPDLKAQAHARWTKLKEQEENRDHDDK